MKNFNEQIKQWNFTQQEIHQQHIDYLINNNQNLKNIYKPLQPSKSYIKSTINEEDIVDVEFEIIDDKLKIGNEK